MAASFAKNRSCFIKVKIVIATASGWRSNWLGVSQRSLLKHAFRPYSRFLRDGVTAGIALQAARH